MKKLNLLLTVILLTFMYSLQGQGFPFNTTFSVTEASCYNNGKIAYALTDSEGNVMATLPEGLSQVRAYYKLSESDSAHYAGWYYMGGVDTLTVNSGIYIVGVEGLLEDGGGYVIVDTHLLMVVGTTYQKPDVAALYTVPRRYENAGLVPSVSCLNTGRVQLRIEKGRFPYTVTVCDHVTGDTLRTTVFDNRQFNGTNPDYYNYKDYYSFDSMPAGNWDFYLVDGCGYGYPRINQNVAATQLPKMNNIYVYASTGDFTDSNVVNVQMELDRDASLFEELMDQYVRYRFVYEGLMDGEWKKIPSCDISMTLYDTLSEMGRYCDIMGRDITLEYKISLCEDTVFRKTFQYNRPNPIYFQKDTVDIRDSIAFDLNPCIRFAYWHRHQYSIRYYSDLYNDGIYVPRRLTAGHDHIYYRYHYTHPLTWEYTDVRNGGVIKRDTVATVVDFSHLYDTDVEEIYGSFRDTAIIIPVERKLLDAKGCVLYTTLDTMIFFHRRDQVSNCWGISHSGDDHCCEQMREVLVHAGYIPRVDPDGTIVRLVESPYNNRYNFEAVYHSDTRSWQVVKASVENTSLVSGGVDGFSLALRDYCLSSGPYTFEIITPCDSFTVSDHINFPYIHRTHVAEEPSYSVIRECANLYLKYTRGKLFNVIYNTSPETGLPLEEENQQVAFWVDVISGPSGGYSPRRYMVGDMIRISLPGTYVFRVYANPYAELCLFPEYYDTVTFDETTVEFEYAFALLCDSSSTSGNAFVLGSNGVKPYTYTLYDHPDKQGEVLAINNTGVFLDVPMRSDQEMSCLVEDSCHAYFHVNFYPRALADLQKIWFDGGLTVQSACEGSTIQIHALSIGDVLQYEWSGPNQFYSVSSDPYVFVPRNAEGGWYKVVIHNNSCSEILMDSIYLTLQSAPGVALEQDTLVCPGQPVELRFTPYTPLVDSLVSFTIAFVNGEGVETRQYSALSGVTVTDTFVTTTDAKIYPLWVNDGRCDYTLADPDDTLFVQVRTEVPRACTISTTNDTVCHGGDAHLFARSDMEPPYTLRWYGDYGLSHLLKTEEINDTAIWSSYDTLGIVQRTLLFAAVEKEGMCPPVNGLYANTMNMAEGTTVLECGQGIRLYDSGGADGNYHSGEHVVHHFVSSDGKPVSVIFRDMELSTTSHLLVITGQELLADSVLYEFAMGVDNPGILVSKGNVLTLVFMSGEAPAAGWSASVEQAPGVAIADVWRSDTVHLYDEVCQSQTASYDDPYGLAPLVVSSEELAQAIRQAGTYSFTKVLAGVDRHECDSVVIFTLRVNPSYSMDTTVIVYDLDPDGFHWHGNYYTESGEYFYHTNSSDGCDSIEILNLVIEIPEPLTCDTTVYDTIYYVVMPTAVEDASVTVACLDFQDITGPGVYSRNDTLITDSGCDSILTVYLIVEEIVRDTVCESEFVVGDGWIPNVNATEWNGNVLEYQEIDEYGYYEFHGEKELNGIGIDTVTYLKKTVNPVYERADVMELCRSEELFEVPYRNHEDIMIVVRENGFVDLQTLGGYEIITLGREEEDFPFIIRMQTVDGCDSIIHLTVRVVDVTRDTIVERVQHISGEDYDWVLAGHEFHVDGAGVQTFVDTLPGSGGCDSITTRILIVEECHTTFGDTTAVACESFTWHGTTYTESGDYTSYQSYTSNSSGCDSVVTLHLTINHTTFGDTTAVACESFTWRGTTYTESGDYTSYQSYTSNSSGCDSVVTLHLTINNLSLSVVSHTDEVCGDDGSVMVSTTDGLEPVLYSIDGVNYQSSNEFSGLSDGNYMLYARDANGCEATTTVTIAPAPIAVLTLTCPPTHHDTLAYGDCVMEIYPETFGTPTATIYPAEWPFEITNDIPADNLYYEGVTMITYTMTDQVCGNTATCSDSIVVVFPQCPDAVDCEGNVYHGVRIGCDCWTQTNLLSNCYGEPNECVITSECDDPIPCVYEYESDQFPDVDQNVEIYGRLYCAEAALDDSVINENGHIRGICPKGWYLPTLAQYGQLYLYGGGTSILTANGLRSPLYWFDGGGNNATGFSALPAGYYNGAAQQFERMTLDTYFWATEVIHGEVHITSYRMQYDCDELQRVDINSGYGISVRCVKEKN